MTGRVARRIEHFRFESAELVAVSVRDAHINARDFVTFGIRADNGAIEFGFQIQIPIGVIGMIMGGQNMGQLPAFVGKSLLYGGGFRSIDRCRQIVDRIMNQDTKIVAQARKLVNI